MAYFLSPDAVLKRLEMPAVYHIGKDELYELDEEAFAFLRSCISDGGCRQENDEFIAYCLREGILTSQRSKQEHPLPVPSPSPSLRYLELQITDKCNLRCRHCYIGEAETAELDIGAIEDIFREFEEMQGLRLMITGGEPLLHSRFSDINALLPRFSFRKVLFTNGLLLTSPILKALKVEELQVSIDGIGESHDALRGTGSFQKSMRAIHRALDAGLDISVATMVHRGNLGDFAAMAELFRSLGIREWTVDVPCFTGRLRENPEFAVPAEEGGKFLSYGYGNGLHGSTSGYACGLHLMAVMADGKAAKCTFYAGSPAGTAAEGLRTCWQRIQPVRLDSLQCDCEHIESCRGGCRYRAELLGDPLGRDLYRCALYR